MNAPRAATWLFASAVVAAASATAVALPVDQTAEGTDDDARLILTVGSRVIDGDIRSRCGVRIIIRNEHVSFSHGDRVTIRVFEDDPIGDDELFTETLEFGPLEVGAGFFERLLDCSGPFGEDAGDSLEIYATALVEKQDCGLGCRQDRPKTGTLDVAVVGDDSSEDVDDQPAGATEIGEGSLGGQVAADQDWYVFRAQVPARTVIDVVFRPLGGEVAAWIEGSDGRLMAELSPSAEGGRMDVEVPGGLWFLVIRPMDPQDPNFYDLRLAIRPPEPECEPGATSTVPCGACGSSQLSCDDEGRWPAIQEGRCEGQGECRPGDIRIAQCDQCARRSDLCDRACRWVLGQCEGGGDCDPGVWNSEDCGDSGVRSRICRDTCGWSAFGPCRTAEEAGAEAPDSPCASGGHPEAEVCDDGVDNDCDGSADGDDLDCAAEQAGGFRLGLSDPCDRTSDCDPDPLKALQCIGAPEYPMFEDGYCAQIGCTDPAACAGAGGVCGVAFGQVWCLRPCGKLSDCLVGHHCANLGTSVATGEPLRACVPPCRGHGDCVRGGKIYCSPRTGRCETPPDERPGTAPEKSVGSDDGCATAVQATPRSRWLPLRR